MAVNQVTNTTSPIQTKANLPSLKNPVVAASPETKPLFIALTESDLNQGTKSSHSEHSRFIAETQSKSAALANAISVNDSASKSTGLKQNSQDNANYTSTKSMFFTGAKIGGVGGSMAAATLATSYLGASLEAAAITLVCGVAAAFTVAACTATLAAMSNTSKHHHN